MKRTTAGVALCGVLAAAVAATTGPAKPTPVDAYVRKLEKSLRPAAGQPWKTGDADAARKAIEDQMAGQAVEVKRASISWENNKLADSILRVAPFKAFGIEWDFQVRCFFTPESREKAKKLPDGSTASVRGVVERCEKGMTRVGGDGVSLIGFNVTLRDAEIR